MMEYGGYVVQFPQCQMCGAQFDSVGILDSHIRMFHSSLPSFSAASVPMNATPVFPTSQSYTIPTAPPCIIAPAIAASAAPSPVSIAVTSHSNSSSSPTTSSSSPKQEYSCPICQKAFSVLSNMRRHIKHIHENLKQHCCEVCGKSFTQKTNMKRHMKTHAVGGSGGSVDSSDFPDEPKLATIGSQEEMMQVDSEQYSHYPSVVAYREVCDGVSSTSAGYDQELMHLTAGSSGEYPQTMALGQTLDANIAEGGLSRAESSGVLNPAELIASESYQGNNPNPSPVGRIPSLERCSSSSGGIAFVLPSDPPEMQGAFTCTNFSPQAYVPARGVPIDARNIAPAVQFGRYVSDSSSSSMSRQWSSDSGYATGNSVSYYQY
eukprot:TRINITY_DN2506_c0_g1_i1.p1 TRINITY_DN2506_c0_g1~~TRINITY_DN2506_c0_g1_i1.p1  ORF type:complete len:377 (-),score=65.83 TRINITY_DN2506_c0_g1_i1:70-1200(-)